jgi:hypothetical protein
LDSSVNLDQPLTYNDRMRFRKPQDASFQLDPHIDSGALERWSDPIYRMSFKEIYNGDWENHDSFCVNGRGISQMDYQCSFFRCFQGWTSLSEAGPGEGTLRVVPFLKEAIAHVLMRPLLADIPVDEMPS